MTLTELIYLAENRLITLNQAVLTATQQGNAVALASLEVEVAETEKTLSLLRAAV